MPECTSALFDYVMGATIMAFVVPIVILVWYLVFTVIKWLRE